MNTHTLMDPDYLKAEIDYLEILVPQREERVSELQSRIARALELLHYTNYREDDTIVLSKEQVYELLEALVGCKVDFEHTSRTDEFYLKVYKTLMKDRRWLIASKLKFLKK